MFFAPGEVNRRIRSRIPSGLSSYGRRLRAVDVLRWTMQETCEDILHYLPPLIRNLVDFTLDIRLCTKHHLY